MAKTEAHSLKWCKCKKCRLEFTYVTGYGESKDYCFRCIKGRRKK